MAYGPSSAITTAPTFSVSSVSSGSITFDLTSIPTGATAVTFMYRARGTGVWVTATARTATGTFAIGSLTDGETYDFVAIPQESTGEVGPASGPLRVALSGGAAVFGLEEVMDAIEDTLRAMVWPGSANSVFGQSVVQVATPGIMLEELDKLRPPFALIYEQGESGSLADENPQLTTLRIGITIATVVDGDLFGTKALRGANRASEMVSKGAGIFDLHDRIMADLAKLLRNSTYPVRFLARYASATGSAQVNESRRCASKGYTLLVAVKEA